MRRALAWARLSAAMGDVPIGAVLVKNGMLAGAAHDSKELLKDPCAHAEVLALREAGRRTGDWRLDGAALYVTLEPCPMCAGAIVQARVHTVIYGASNTRWGIESAGLNIFQNERFNHRVEVISGVLEKECAQLLRDTFRLYRKPSGGA